MMRLPTALIMSVLVSHAATNAAGLELTLSKPHPGYAAEGRWIGSLSYFRISLYPWPGFSEWGITAMPPVGGPDSGPAQFDKADSFVGIYTGHVFPLWRGLIRPGFQLGSAWEEIGTSSGTTKGEFALYYAFRIQASCLTFILSNRGQGLGVNFSL